MELIYCESLDQPQLDGVWRLLEAYGEDFVPPLSQRRSTCQQALHEDAPSSEGPRAYFEEMKHQRFLLAVEGEAVAGFLTFRYDYVPEILAAQQQPELLGLYITTIIVDAAYRRHGLAQGFYRRLMALYPQRRRLISTRTWSGNINHISLLQKLAFTGPVRIPDDRGPGIDTVYYYTLLREGQR